MKPNIGTPLAGQDFPTLQKNLEFVSTKTPSADYPKWAEYSKAGAAAAAKQDVRHQGDVQAVPRRVQGEVQEGVRRQGVPLKPPLPAPR